MDAGLNQEVWNLNQFTSVNNLRTTHPPAPNDGKRTSYGFLIFYHSTCSPVLAVPTYFFFFLNICGHVQPVFWNVSDLLELSLKLPRNIGTRGALSTPQWPARAIPMLPTVWIILQLVALDNPDLGSPKPKFMQHRSNITLGSKGYFYLCGRMGIETRWLVDVVAVLHRRC